MSKIAQLLDSIFQNNGGTTKQWRAANEILLTKSDETKKYVAYMKNKIRDLNKDTQLLALNFLDYSIDDGKMPLWTQVGSKDFLSSLVNIYKTRNNEEVQNKILFLIKKWANKFQKYNSIIPNFTLTYENLKNNDVTFPHDVESTYEKYLQGPEISSGFGGNESKKIKKMDNNISQNKSYVKDINVDLRTNSYEKKYKRLVNKLDDWTEQIQEANVYMDLAQGGNFNDELRGICDELETGKKQLVDTIESGKLKDETLMEISLNVQDDIEMTLNRWEDVKNGRNPQPFKSAFFNKRDNNNSNNNSNNNYSNNNNDNNNNVNNTNNNQNKGGFDLLGFDNDFGGNNNNLNSNKGNDLLDVFSGTQSNQGNDFFSNMGNNNPNNNNNFFGNNNNQNNNNNNNNFFGNNNNQNNNNNFFGNNNNQNNNNNFFGNNNNQNNNNNNFFGNNSNQNNNNNFFGNNQTNSNQNTNNNDLFSQMFNNNNTNNNNFTNMNNNNNNMNSNNNFNLLQNNLNNAFNNNNNEFVNLSNNAMNNQMNFGNNNNTNFNNNGFNNNNNNNFNFNYNNINNKNNKNTSNKDYVFDF